MDAFRAMESLSFCLLTINLQAVSADKWQFKGLRAMSVFEWMSNLDHEQIVFCHDRSTGLKAIIGIHNTTMGPALGGCRMWDYKSEEEALKDVVRLSRGMTYKAVMAGLALGGGKSVIIGDPKKLKSQAFFRAFGRFVESLGGRYITAEDVNIKVQDMEYVAMETKAVTGIGGIGGSGDPSPVTALGVYWGIKAAVQHKLGKESLAGVRVGVQGVGSVGSWLCKYLNDDGAKLVVGDIRKESVDRMVELYGAETADANAIHKEDVDVFAPCALGAGLNDETIPQIKATIVAGAANNQLADEDKHGRQLLERGILYAPDYVINAGGLINVYQELKGYDEKAAKAKAKGIFDTLIEIFERSTKENKPTNETSDAIAEQRITTMAAVRQTWQSQFSVPWVAMNKDN
jgi:leucine dehydrogenase